MYVQEQVSKIIKKYKTRDPFTLCDYLNITILHSDLGTDVRGFYQSYKRKTIIHLNCDLIEPEQRIVLAHELGHAIMHKGYNCIFLARHDYLTKDKYEYQANLFAAELLLPDRVDYEYSGMSCCELAAVYEVNPKLVEMKWGNNRCFFNS